MKEVKLTIVGFGLIGKGLAKTLAEKAGRLRRKNNIDFSVVAVCEKDGCVVDKNGINLNELLAKGLREHSGWSNAKTIEVIKNVESDIVVELTPGNVKTGEPGMSHIKSALGSGKHVVTSNKAPLAIAYAELMKLAGEKKLQIGFEATCGGAIPIINAAEYGLHANSLTSIYGILNGTTNFILSKMAKEGVSLEAALAEAQELGLAEPDPTYDISGLDTAQKLVILGNALLEESMTLSDVKIVGIKDVTPEAVDLAEKHGYSIKLIGDVIGREVSPRLVPKSHPLNVSGSLNAITILSDVAGELTFAGPGAGPRETSSAILSDLVNISGGLA